LNSALTSTGGPAPKNVPSDASDHSQDMNDPDGVTPDPAEPTARAVAARVRNDAWSPRARGENGADDDTAPDWQALTAAGADMDTVATTDGSYRYVSPASRRLFGHDPSVFQGRHEDEFVHPDDLPAVGAGRATAPGSQVFTITYRLRCADGSYCWVESTSRRVEVRGTPFLVATVRDISERQQAGVLLRHQAMSDPLTGVGNRAVLMDRLRQALRRQERGTGVLAVLFLDLDRFKVINDSMGHRVGDGVLQTMAQRLLRFLRASDTLARMGGDEFVIVAEGVVNEQAAMELGNRISQAGREPYQVGDEEFVCTVSVGIATTADSRHSPEGLLHEADLALYRAKDRGRDRAEAFDEALRTTAVGRLATERMLRRAIAEQRLRVHYQPIIDLRSGSPVSAEALVRIFDPQLGMLSPDSFLEVADETGLLVTIDEWVLAAAVQEATRWQARSADTGFSGVSVNITGRHLADERFTRGLIASLDKHGLLHAHRHVEVTERALMESSNSAMTGLRSLRDAGVKVGLDDFGTGFSSLAYLRQFPLDFIKIDTSLIHRMDGASGEEAIVAAIISLSHALGLSVIAEGVDTQHQLASLKSLGCDRAQGFLLARPGEPDAVDALIAGSPRGKRAGPRRRR
jgi:diguanylate cyclase (GGDEF)-like protein/PAS domain S-box-containing protein